MEYMTTEEFAATLATKAASVRSRYCIKGHYFGVRPFKLPNGRLLWPATDPTQLIAERGEDAAK